MVYRDAQERKIVEWIEREVGGTVETLERQMRWRPAWYLTLRKDGELLPLYVRGDRGEIFPKEPIEYELALYRALEPTGIPVPKCYGICPDPHALVMERVPGTFRLLDNARDAEEVRSVLLHLAEIQAEMHGLAVEPFFEAGVARPKDMLHSFSPVWVDADESYLAHRTGHDPRIEFMRRWVEHNMPSHPTRLSFLHGDPGQFLFADGKVTAMIDFEIACVGDPHLDLAGYRSRAIYEPMGDMTCFFERYGELTDFPVDAGTLAWHSVPWLGINLLYQAASIKNPEPGSNVVEYISWYVVCYLNILWGMAEAEGFTLEEPEPLGGSPSRWSPVLDRVERNLLPEGDVRADDYDRHLNQIHMAFTRRLATHGPLLEDEYIRDTRTLTGVAVADWAEADRVLEEFVLSAGPEHNEQLIRTFYRWCHRQTELVRGLVVNPTLDQRMMPAADVIAAIDRGRQRAGR